MRRWSPVRPPSGLTIAPLVDWLSLFDRLPVAACQEPVTLLPVTQFMPPGWPAARKLHTLPFADNFLPLLPDK